MSVEQVLATLVLAVCLALLVHHFAGARGQARIDSWWRAVVSRVRRAWNRLRLWRRTRQLRRAQHEAREASEAMQGAAAREAADVIERARRSASTPDGDEAAHGANGQRGPAGEVDPRQRGGVSSGGPAGDAPRPGGDNVVRPQRFGNRRNDLH